MHCRLLPFLLSILPLSSLAAEPVNKIRWCGNDIKLEKVHGQPMFRKCLTVEEAVQRGLHIPEPSRSQFHCLNVRRLLDSNHDVFVALYKKSEVELSSHEAGPGGCPARIVCRHVGYADPSSYLALITAGGGGEHAEMSQCEQQFVDSPQSKKQLATCELLWSASCGKH